MKFTLVTETFPPEINGVAMTLDRLVQGLHQRGGDVTVITPQRKNRPEGISAYCRLVSVRGIPIPQYPELRLGLPANRRLKTLWTRSRPDLVHVATEGLLGWSAVNVALQLGLPVISSYHTNFHNYGNHYGFGLFKPAILQWLRHFHNRSLKTFVPSSDLIDQLAIVGFMNLRLFARGVDSEVYGPHRRDRNLRKSWGVDEDTPVALYVGRLAPEKNLQLLIRAYQVMQEVLPSLKLVLVGDGPERNRLQEVLPEAHFAGTLKGLSLAAHYASADCFLFPSLSETFGNVVTEAMCSALPVLAYDYAAPGRFIRTRSNGFLAPCNDENAFMKSARELAFRQSSWMQMGKAARETILPHSWDSVINSYMREIDPILHPVPA